MHKKYLILILTISMTLLPLLNIEGQKFNVFVPQSNDTNSLTTKQGGSIYNNTVLVLMNTTLNSSIYNEVSTFVQDIINGLKCNASLYVYPNSWTPSNLRNFLNNTYQNFGLRGAILIGQAPAFFYEHIYQVPAVKYFRFPWDYYYMDLDCKFTDLDGNLTADSMSGNIGPEIWVSRIDAHKLSNEVNLYKDFFARNNLVRNVSSRGAQRGLLWIDDDWAGYPWSYQLNSCLAELYPTANRTLYNNTVIAPVTDKVEYLSNLTLDYEWLFACIHSWPDMHQFKSSLMTASWLEINQTMKNMEFYNLYCCKAGNFTYPNYLAGWYIFGNTSGQVSISCAREGGFWYGTHDFYKDLSGGDSIGDAWKEMYLRGYRTSKYPTGFREPFPTYWQWMGNNLYWGNYTEGTNLFGDPTLQNCKNPTNITITPVTIEKSLFKKPTSTLTIKITDNDQWSLYNVSLLIEANFGSGWQVLSTNSTDINGEVTITLNLDNLSEGQIDIRASYAGSPNFYPVIVIANVTIKDLTLIEILIIISSINQPPGIADFLVSPIGLAIIGASVALILILIILAVRKKK